MTVSRDEIMSAYRWVLGRNPSSEEIEPWLGVGSAADLRRIFLRSPEFAASAPGCDSQSSAKSRSHSDSLPHDLAPAHVEWETDSRTSAGLLDHVASTWNKLGRERPHWSVLSSDDFLPGRIETTADAFYASGATDANRIVSALARHGIRMADMKSVVEFGCGVGRVTPYLARTFPSVTACDISESHLRLACDTVRRSGHTNVHFQLTRPPDFGLNGSFDLWFSCLVLQHNPPPVIAMILRQAFARLAPGGVAMFQVPTYSLGYQFATQAYLASPTATGTIEVHCLPQAVVFHLAHQAGCVPLELREDGLMGPPSAWLSNTFLFRKPHTS